MSHFSDTTATFRSIGAATPASRDGDSAPLRAAIPCRISDVENAVRDVEDVLHAARDGDIAAVHKYLLSIGADPQVVERLRLPQKPGPARRAQLEIKEMRIACCIRDEQLKTAHVPPAERLHILTEEFAGGLTVNVIEYIASGQSYGPERREARRRMVCKPKI